MKKVVTNIIIGIVLVFILWFILGMIGINAAYAVPAFIEWVTKFVFPWIALYWFIRFVKSFE